MGAKTSAATATPVIRRATFFFKQRAERILLYLQSAPNWHFGRAGRCYMQSALLCPAQTVRVFVATSVCVFHWVAAATNAQRRTSKPRI